MKKIFCLALIFLFSIPMQNWGALPKSQTDSTTIDQEIDAKIAAHLADDDAHLAEGGSLQSHRASEIIDHLAESVLNDKIQPEARAYVAIVAQDGSGDFDDIQEAVSYAHDKGGGVIFVKKGVYPQTGNINLGALTDLEGDGKNETIIDFQNGAYGIKGHKLIKPWGDNVIFLSTSAGSDIFTFSSEEGFPKEMMAVGMSIYDAEYYGEIWRVTEIIDATHYRVDRAYGATTDGQEMHAYAAVSNPLGQTTFSVPSYIDLLALGVRPGMLAEFGVAVDGYLGVNQTQTITEVTAHTFTINSAITNNSWTDFDIYEPRRNYNRIRELDIKNSTADYAVDCSDAVDCLIQDVGFYTVKGILYSVPPWGSVLYQDKIRNINFSGATGSLLFNQRGFNYDNISGSYATNGGAIFAAGDYISIENCYIDMGSQTANYITYGYGSRVHIANSTFLNVSKFTTGAYVPQKWNVHGNIFIIANSRAFEHRLAYAAITGNTYNLGSGSSVSFLSGDSYNVFCGNAGAGTITDSGTGNVKTGNT